MGAADTNSFSSHISSGNWSIMQWFAALNASGSPTTSTYNLFEDQVTLAGRVYTDAMLTNLYSSSPYKGGRHFFAFAVIRMTAKAKKCLPPL